MHRTEFKKKLSIASINDTPMSIIVKGYRSKYGRYWSFSTCPCVALDMPGLDKAFHYVCRTYGIEDRQLEYFDRNIARHRKGSLFAGSARIMGDGFTGEQIKTMLLEYSLPCWNSAASYLDEVVKKKNLTGDWERKLAEEIMGTRVFHTREERTFKPEHLNSVFTPWNEDLR